MRINFRRNCSRIVYNCIIIHVIYIFSRQYRVIINYNVSSNKYNVYHNATRHLTYVLGNTHIYAAQIHTLTKQS